MFDHYLTPEALEDYNYWLDNDQKMLRKINKLILDCKKDPFSGIGKPEPLRHNLSGLWSRRISAEHRMLYNVKDNKIVIYQLRNHYR